MFGHPAVRITCKEKKAYQAAFCLNRLWGAVGGAGTLCALANTELPTHNPTEACEGGLVKTGPMSGPPQASVASLRPRGLRCCPAVFRVLTR